MKKRVVVLSVLVLIVVGCSKDYQASEGATGKSMFDAACVACHKPLDVQADKYFELAASNMNAEYVSNKVSSGSLMMPKFPNLKGAELKALSEYVVEHSAAKAE